MEKQLVLEPKDVSTQGVNIQLDEEEDWFEIWQMESPELFMTDEEIEARIACLEECFGMSSEEFLRQVENRTAPDEDGIIEWKLLLKYRPVHADV